jgi:acetyl-CoA synthetase
MAKAPPSPEEIVDAALSESEIAVHWREEDYYPPPGDFVKQANANDPAILERFSPDNFPDSYTDFAEMLTWDKKWDEVLDSSDPPFFKWFVGGKLNACVNCCDRHMSERGDKNAIIWVPELEDEENQEISYRELHRRVNEFAALLRDFAGLEKQDRVTFHLPMVPELPVSMLAAARSAGSAASPAASGWQMPRARCSSPWTPITEAAS